MSEEANPGVPPSRPPSSPWAKIFYLFLVLIFAGLCVFFSFVWLGNRAINATKEATVEIIERFKPELVVSTFEQWREAKAEGNDGNILEVAVSRAEETFSRKTSLAMFGKTLPLGTTVSEITVPAVYRYHIDLDGEWFLASDGGRLLVLAPPLQPSLPVAFDTAGVRKKTDSGWARWDGAENLETLEKTVTAKLAERAAAEESIATAREAARASVAGFVKDWLVDQDAWGEARFEEISVVFEGEEASLSSQPPSLDLETGTPPVLP